MWRQGVKHDCAAILELKESGGAFTNGNGEPVDVETEWVFPLLKGSDLKALDAGRPTKRLIVTQRRIGDDTSQIRVVAPKLWRYLVHNSRLFEKRMSSIYRGKPRFAIFGVGDYAFRPYKVAISGLHKRPHFSLVTPVGRLPVMLDDTSYFLGFDAYRDALMTAALLNSPPILELLESIAFLDAKRPYTKEVLMRIDLGEAARRTSFEALRTLWANANYKPEEPISDADFEAYQCSVREGSVIPQMELEL